MEIKRLYVIDFNNKKHFFITQHDANYYFNSLKVWQQKEVKKYIIIIEEGD